MDEVTEHTRSPKKTKGKRWMQVSHRTIFIFLQNWISSFCSLCPQQISSHNHKLLIEYTSFKVKPEIRANNFCRFIYLFLKGKNVT